MATVASESDIVRVIGEYVSLMQTTPENYIGMCPFHVGRTKSFLVNAKLGQFNCFGCHARGDVFAFVMKAETIGFREAVRVVAETCGR